MRATVFLVFLWSVFVTFGQDRGKYEHTCTAPSPRRIVTETGEQFIFAGIHVPIPQTLFRSHSLFIKRFGRFEIKGPGTITDDGLNTDNPTIYGRYKKRGDTLILTYKKSIQHFNKSAPKRRVKVKWDTVQRYLVLEDGKLETEISCYWYRVED